MMDILINCQHLTVEEKRLILSVLQRDDAIQQVALEKVQKLKDELKEIRLNSVIKSGEDPEKICVRCRTKFGFIFDRGNLCPKCHSKVCQECEMALPSQGQWLCKLCYKQRELDKISGNWLKSEAKKKGCNKEQLIPGSIIVKASIKKELGISSKNKSAADDLREALSSDGSPTSQRSHISSQDGSTCDTNIQVGFPSEKESKGGLFDLVNFRKTGNQQNGEIRVQKVRSRHRSESSSSDESLPELAVSTRSRTSGSRTPELSPGDNKTRDSLTPTGDGPKSVSETRSTPLRNRDGTFVVEEQTKVKFHRVTKHKAGDRTPSPCGRHARSSSGPIMFEASETPHYHHDHSLLSKSQSFTDDVGDASSYNANMLHASNSVSHTSSQLTGKSSPSPWGQGQLLDQGHSESDLEQSDQEHFLSSQEYVYEPDISSVMLKGTENGQDLPEIETAKSSDDSSGQFFKKAVVNILRAKRFLLSQQSSDEDTETPQGSLCSIKEEDSDLEREGKKAPRYRSSIDLDRLVAANMNIAYPLAPQVSAEGDVLNQLVQTKFQRDHTPIGMSSKEWMDFVSSVKLLDTDVLNVDSIVQNNLEYAKEEKASDIKPLKRSPWLRAKHSHGEEGKTHQLGHSKQNQAHAEIQAPKILIKDWTTPRHSEHKDQVAPLGKLDDINFNSLVADTIALCNACQNDDKPDVKKYEADTESPEANALYEGKPLQTMQEEALVNENEHNTTKVTSLQIETAHTDIEAHLKECNVVGSGQTKVDLTVKERSDSKNGQDDLWREQALKEFNSVLQDDWNVEVKSDKLEEDLDSSCNSVDNHESQPLLRKISAQSDKSAPDLSFSLEHSLPCAARTVPEVQEAEVKKEAIALESDMLDPQVGNSLSAGAAVAIEQQEIPKPAEEARCNKSMDIFVVISPEKRNEEKQDEQSVSLNQPIFTQHQPKITNVSSAFDKCKPFDIGSLLAKQEALSFSNVPIAMHSLKSASPGKTFTDVVTTVPTDGDIGSNLVSSQMNEDVETSNASISMTNEPLVTEDLKDCRSSVSCRTLEEDNGQGKSKDLMSDTSASVAIIDMDISSNLELPERTGRRKSSIFIDEESNEAFTSLTSLLADLDDKMQTDAFDAADGSKVEGFQAEGSSKGDDLVFTEKTGVASEAEPEELITCTRQIRRAGCMVKRETRVPSSPEHSNVFDQSAVMQIPVTSDNARQFVPNQPSTENSCHFNKTRERSSAASLISSGVGPTQDSDTVTFPSMILDGKTSVHAPDSSHSLEVSPQSGSGSDLESVISDNASLEVSHPESGYSSSLSTSQPKSHETEDGASFRNHQKRLSDASAVSVPSIEVTHTLEYDIIDSDLEDEINSSDEETEGPDSDYDTDSELEKHDAEKPFYGSSDENDQHFHLDPFLNRAHELAPLSPNRKYRDERMEFEGSKDDDEDIDELVKSHKSTSSLLTPHGSDAESNSSIHPASSIGEHEDDAPPPGPLSKERGSKLSMLLGSKESITSYYSDAGEGLYGMIPVQGEIMFGLDYNYKTGTFIVNLKQCRDLSFVDERKKRTDPYVKVYLLPDKTRTGKRKSKVKKNTTNPLFDEQLRYQLCKSELESRTLWLSVWHNDIFGRNAFLGEIMQAMDYFEFNDPTPTWHQLQERALERQPSFLRRAKARMSPLIGKKQPSLTFLAYKGDLVVALKFVTPDKLNILDVSQVDSKGELHCCVKEARNLTAVRANGYSDPFCKGYLLPDKSKHSKQKTPTIKKNCNPKWNNVLKFDDISLEELPQKCLELTVWDYDRIGSNQFLGGARLNMGPGSPHVGDVDWMDAKGEEISIWRGMLERPNMWVEGSIQLRPSMDKRH